MAALRTALQASYRQQADDVETNRQGCENRPQDGAAAENEQQDPVAPEAAGRITIFFEDLNQARMTFKLKTTTKFKKAMDKWAENAQRDVQSLRFLFDGIRMQDDSTPQSVSVDAAYSSVIVFVRKLTSFNAQMEMEDEDIVHVHNFQIGGGVV